MERLRLASSSANATWYEAQPRVFAPGRQKGRLGDQRVANGNRQALFNEKVVPDTVSRPIVGLAAAAIPRGSGYYDCVAATHRPAPDSLIASAKRTLSTVTNSRQLF
jgi:hypothetical protein